MRQRKASASTSVSPSSLHQDQTFQLEYETATQRMGREPEFWDKLKTGRPVCWTSRKQAGLENCFVVRRTLAGDQEFVPAAASSSNLPIFRNF